MYELNSRVGFSPSDVNNFLECQHLTQLELAVGKKRLDAPKGRTVRADLIARKGDEHEAAYLASLKEAGKEVVEIPSALGAEPQAAAEATLAALQDGAEVVYQGAFLHDGWTPEQGSVIVVPDDGKVVWQFFK